MKKMKSLKQQMMTVFSLALVLMAIAVCTPDQALAQQRMRKGASANPRITTTSRQTQTNRRTPSFTTDLVIDVSGYFAPNKSFSGAPTQSGTFNTRQRNNAAQRSASGGVWRDKPNNLTVNAGSGNDTLNVQSRTARPNRIAGDWNGDGADTIGRRRNLLGSPEYFNSYSKPKTNLTATTYGRGSFAKARAKRDH